MSEEKLFGMPAEKGRWMFVVLGFIINICLGSVYAYSVFRGPVQKLLNMSATEAGLPFMVFLALFATMVFFGGLILAKLGPKMLGWLGGVVAPADRMGARRQDGGEGQRDRPPARVAADLREEAQRVEEPHAVRVQAQVERLHLVARARMQAANDRH